MKVNYRLFRGTFSTWDELFGQAAEFANRIGPINLINISHAVAGSDGTVTVWYWVDEEGDAPA